MDYRNKFYSKYVSAHLSDLYGERDLSEIKKQFPVWKKYFGGFLPADKQSKIIDLGCGNGSFVNWLDQSGYKNAEGIDASGEQVEAAKKYGFKNVQKADIGEFLKSKKGYYDAIFMRDVLEHFNKEEILEIMELVYSALSENGAVILHSPNGESPFSGRYRYWDFTHETAFTKASMHQLLGVSGFSKTEFYSTGPIVHGVKSLIRYFLWKGIEFILKFYLLVETGSGGGIFTQNFIAVARK